MAITEFACWSWCRETPVKRGPERDHPDHHFSSGVLAGRCLLEVRQPEAGRPKTAAASACNRSTAVRLPGKVPSGGIQAKALPGTTAKCRIISFNKHEFAAIYKGAPKMMIDERKALNTQKPNTEKVYETNTKVSPRTGKPASPAGQDGVALNSQDQLRLLAMTPTAEETSRVERLTQLVQSGQ